MASEWICKRCNGVGDVEICDENDRFDRHTICTSCAGRGYIYKHTRISSPEEPVDAMKAAIQAIENIKKT